jgi:hypothetical protein
MVEDSADKYGHLFPGLEPVAMENIVNAYISTVEQAITGQILRVY